MYEFIQWLVLLGGVGFQVYVGAKHWQYIKQSQASFAQQVRESIDELAGDVARLDRSKEMALLHSKGVLRQCDNLNERLKLDAEDLRRLGLRDDVIAEAHDQLNRSVGHIERFLEDRGMTPPFLPYREEKVDDTRVDSVGSDLSDVVVVNTPGGPFLLPDAKLRDGRPSENR